MQPLIVATWNPSGERVSMSECVHTAWGPVARAAGLECTCADWLLQKTAHHSASLVPQLAAYTPSRRSIGKWNFWNWLLSHKTERYNLLGASRARFPKRSGFMEFLEWNFWTACVSRRGVISVVHLAARDFALHHIVSTWLFYYFYPSAPTHTHEFRKFQKCLSKNSIKYGWA